MNLIDKVKLFSGLDNELKTQISKKLESKKFKKGAIIFSPNEKCYSLSLILEGRVRLCKYSSDGSEQIISILDRGSVFGEALVFDNANYPVYVIAEADCVIGVIRREAILELTRQSAHFTLAYLGELSRKIRILNDKLDYLSYPTVKQRIAKYLLHLSAGQGSSKIFLKQSKQKISQILGTSREVVSRNFSLMEKVGYFESEGEILSLNIQKLEELI